ncbi:MAG: MCE family protein [Gammaproteobacteria bacterium]|nr:MCE family protein [Gammaproteobacteria bacterium]
MTETDNHTRHHPQPLPDSVVMPKSRISMVWLIPLVALLTGGWLAYKTYSEQGSTITISFTTASGLQAGKTKVKFKDVEIGAVTAIRVAEDLKTVVVTAELVKGSELYLTRNTRFWVERPRVTASRVSGLETLLSGAYIAIDPVTEGTSERSFVGIEEPPLFTTSEPGTQYALHSDTLGSLNVGSPVYYRSIQVGQVASYGLNNTGEKVIINIFVAAPYDRLVLTNTRFWNVSGLDFEVNTEGLQVDTQSLLSVLVGGIAFDNPGFLEEKGEPANARYRFPLYASQVKANEKVYLEKDRYLMFFEGSVRGLNPGSPVMLRGIKIGQVLDVQLKFDTEAFEFSIPVLVEIEPDRIGLTGDRSLLEEQEVIARLVSKGLRGQLKSGSLLTGQLFVDLDFHPEAPAAAITTRGNYSVVPTVATPIDAIVNKVDDLMNKILAFPLDEIGENLQGTLKGTNDFIHSGELTRAVAEFQLLLKQIRETTEGLEQNISPEVTATLQQARSTLKSVEGVVTEDSTLYMELHHLIRELSAAARSIRGMAEYLERHPEALIKGKGR